METSDINKGQKQPMHDSCGQFGLKKIHDHVLYYFFWPLFKKYVKSCHACQLAGEPIKVVEPALLFFPVHVLASHLMVKWHRRFWEVHSVTVEIVNVPLYT